MDKILVPTDGGKSTVKAAEIANKQAQKFDAEVHVLCVQELSGPQGNVSGPRVYVPKEDSIIEDYLHKVVNNLDSNVQYLTTTRKATSASAEILNYAEEENINLIVMGTHGKTGAKRLLIGSVAEKVMRNSKVPVLTVREEATVF